MYILEMNTTINQPITWKPILPQYVVGFLFVCCERNCFIGGKIHMYKEKLNIL